VPAAAVIPAPIAYVKVAAVKKLVVECRDARTSTVPKQDGLGPRSLTFGHASVRSDVVPISLP
jgi:hypothetical protein